MVQIAAAPHTYIMYRHLHLATEQKLWKSLFHNYTKICKMQYINPNINSIYLSEQKVNKIM